MYKNINIGANMIVLVLIGVFSILTIFTGSISAQDEYKMAAVLPGSIQDADWNTIGYNALQEVNQNLKIEVAYSEQIAVPDVSRVIREYIDLGYNILWIHGTQFNSAVFDLADQYKDVVFIIEQDTPLDGQYDNIFRIKRNYYIGHYVIGALASEVTETKNIGFVGGLEISWTIGVVNAIQQAIAEHNPDVDFDYIYVGSFNDPLKTKQATESLINKGVDIIISGVNLGNYGMFRAIEDNNNQVYVTSLYTDKYELSPEHFLTSDMFNYNDLIIKIVNDIVNNNVKSAFYNMKYGQDEDRYLKYPVINVSTDINHWIKEIADKVAEQEIIVEEKLDEIR
ncbi:MAG: BMP family protein [Halanaerobiales bacterium]|nr:BMP family protein [Halanaerobiales bacterium]